MTKQRLIPKDDYVQFLKAFDNALEAAVGVYDFDENEMNRRNKALNKELERLYELYELEEKKE